MGQADDPVMLLILYDKRGVRLDRTIFVASYKLGYYQERLGNEIILVCHLNII